MRRKIIERELQKITIEVDSLLSRIDKPEWDNVDIAGVAALIASIYSGYESIFRNLCKNKIQKHERWHTELLDNAITEGFVPHELEAILRDMLYFRHIQRNYYGHELKEPNVRQKANEVVSIILPAMTKHLQQFI
ncbi:MAG: hypothetical protein LBV09_01855 [Deferribacteraceae bacterium]|jgi:hypothetical protein|nr:hypothetical protein [Deferribacteraceae bacterium]